VFAPGDRSRSGAVAQLVAHHTGSVGVRGSSPLSSTQDQLPGRACDCWAAAGRLCELRRRRNDPIWGSSGGAAPGNARWPTIPALKARSCRVGDPHPVGGGGHGTSRRYAHLAAVSIGGTLIVVSVRSAFDSLWYCLILSLWYCLILKHSASSNQLTDTRSFWRPRTVFSANTDRWRPSPAGDQRPVPAACFGIAWRISSARARAGVRSTAIARCHRGHRGGVLIGQAFRLNVTGWSRFGYSDCRGGPAGSGSASTGCRVRRR